MSNGAVVEGNHRPWPEIPGQFHLLHTELRLRGALFDIALYLFLQFAFGLVFLGAGMAAGVVPRTMNVATQNPEPVLIAIVMGLIAASVTMLIVRRKTIARVWSYAPPEHLKYKKTFTAVTMLSALGLSFLYTHWLNEPIQPEYEVFGRMLYEGGLPAIVIILGLVIAGPAVEELLFRVQLQAIIAKKFANRFSEQKAIMAGILISTLIFALIHLQITAAPAQMLVGLALAVVYQRNRSYGEVFVLHGMVNLIGVLTISS